MIQEYNKINLKTSLILFIILLYFSKLINSQMDIPGIILPNTEKCKLKGERRPKGFSDCNTESTSEFICCFLTGTNSGEKYEGCIGMDIEIFANKSFSYEVKDISGTLICDANYNVGFYFKYRFFNFCLFVLIILI